MTIHKLAAGSGYEYLTRQVAAADSTELGTTPLADYYEAKGEAPGRWHGAGLVGLSGIEAGDVVTADQIGHLFGEGTHPSTGAALGRPQRKAGVAGFDLTFSSVKSVSALWAVAPPAVARAIEEAHEAAVADALTYVEREVLFTREGTDGARQVETRGLVAAAFRHRDTRAGDPDLHTHVAVANKVQTLGGKWLSVYGSVLFAHTVAISETYNTALEARLRERLGVRFAERAGSAREKRTVREIVAWIRACVGSGHGGGSRSWPKSATWPRRSAGSMGGHRLRRSSVPWLSRRIWPRVTASTTRSQRQSSARTGAARRPTCWARPRPSTGCCGTRLRPATLPQ